VQGEDVRLRAQVDTLIRCDRTEQFDAFAPPGARFEQLAGHAQRAGTGDNQPAL
jgi:hypothetical protein